MTAIDGRVWIDDVGRMYEVADDAEADILDALRERAGITWECRDDDGTGHWTNRADDAVCQRCGSPRGEGTRNGYMRTER